MSYNPYFSYGNCTPIQYYIPPVPGCQGPTGPAGPSLTAPSEYGSASTINGPSTLNQLITLVNSSSGALILTVSSPIINSGTSYTTINMTAKGDTITLVASNNLANWWIVSINGTVTFST